VRVALQIGNFSIAGRQGVKGVDGGHEEKVDLLRSGKEENREPQFGNKWPGPVNSRSPIVGGGKKKKNSSTEGFRFES